ncbi:MAG: GNAT family N-acetyltransferase [Chloroflexi bacterium]|nr:GNAT family N-acetyltransferase [Chloroflexota bacterium]
MSATQFLSVREDEQQRALDVLVLAFAADPVERWLYPEARQYLTHFPEFLAAFGGKAFTHETVWQLGEFSAVAIWLPPRVEVDGSAIVAVLTETVAPAKHEDTFSMLGQMDDAHPRFPHWYLAWFGVDGAVQGRGLGGELMRHCLTVVDEDHLPVYLDTPNPRSISFYERYGFKVTGQAQAGACPPVVSMLRAAR